MKLEWRLFYFVLKSRFIRLFIVALLISFCFNMRSDIVSSQDECPNPRGWFIKIRPEQTQAPGVRIEIGFGGVGNSHTIWREWRHGEATEFFVPTKYVRAEEIWIKGTSLEEDRNVAMCIGFNDHITQKMCFDEDEEHETSRGDNDDCNCD